MTDRNYALLWANGMGFHDLMRLHAHDLAEKIRAERYHLCSEPYGLEGVESAADLIDPEVDK